jgi:hypothetical protein
LACSGPNPRDGLSRYPGRSAVPATRTGPGPARDGGSVGDSGVFPGARRAPALFSRATVNDLGQADYLGLFAISFNILFKYSGLLSFGHAAFFGFAAYTQALSLQSFAGPPVPLLVLATRLSAAVLGYLIGQICVRRSGAYFSMTTLAIAASFYAVALARCDRRDGRAEQLHAAAA